MSSREVVDDGEPRVPGLAGQVDDVGRGVLAPHDDHPHPVGHDVDRGELVELDGVGEQRSRCPRRACRPRPSAGRARRAPAAERPPDSSSRGSTPTPAQDRVRAAVEHRDERAQRPGEAALQRRDGAGRGQRPAEREVLRDELAEQHREAVDQHDREHDRDGAADRLHRARTPRARRAAGRSTAGWVVYPSRIVVTRDADLRAGQLGRQVAQRLDDRLRRGGRRARCRLSTIAGVQRHERELAGDEHRGARGEQDAEADEEPVDQHAADRRGRRRPGVGARAGEQGRAVAGGRRGVGGGTPAATELPWWAITRPAAASARCSWWHRVIRGGAGHDWACARLAPWPMTSASSGRRSSWSRTSRRSPRRSSTGSRRRGLDRRGRRRRARRGRGRRRGCGPTSWCST